MIGGTGDFLVTMCMSRREASPVDCPPLYFACIDKALAACGLKPHGANPAALVGIRHRPLSIIAALDQQDGDFLFGMNVYLARASSWFLVNLEIFGLR